MDNRQLAEINCLHGSIFLKYPILFAKISMENRLAFPVLNKQVGNGLKILSSVFCNFSKS